MLQFDYRGLIPAIIQDASSAEVLMLGYMNKEALKRTVASGDVWFYSRSRRELWHKGETSGNFLKLKSIVKDCDSDALLVYAEPAGPVCHTGNRTCFLQQLESQDLE
jgi:phosphoribosyl-AMP cyclohydrolase